MNEREKDGFWESLLDYGCWSVYANKKIIAYILTYQKF